MTKGCICYMKQYYLEDFKNKEQYCKFINYMVENSDKFSLVYFKYSENGKVKSTVKEMEKLLRPYKIFSYNGNQWPSTVTLNENNHIYKITLYKVAPGVEEILTKPNDLLDWDYPNLPMDLCFYKNGYSWFASAAHEHYASVYLETKQEYLNLIDLGIDMSFVKDVDQSKLFLESSLKVKVKSFSEANHI